MLPFENPTENLDNARAPDRARDESTVADDGNGVDAEGDGNIETPDKPEYSRWTRVQRKRARSESSLPNKKTLTFAQRKVVQLAEKGLTKEQQQKLQRRQEKVRPRRDSSVSSRGEGTSKRKGKPLTPENGVISMLVVRAWMLRLKRQSLNPMRLSNLRDFRNIPRKRSPDGKRNPYLGMTNAQIILRNPRRGPRDTLDALSNLNQLPR